MIEGERLQIRDGWSGAGKIGIRLGPDVFAEQSWTPILFYESEDPVFFKTAGLMAAPILPPYVKMTAAIAKNAVLSAPGYPNLPIEIIRTSPWWRVLEVALYAYGKSRERNKEKKEE